MSLIQEAIKRGYRKGVAVRYVPHAIDYIEGNYFEMLNGDVLAFKKPKEERKSFEDGRFDTLYSSRNNEWTEIVDLSKRSNEQKILDDLHNIYNK